MKNIKQASILFCLGALTACGNPSQTEEQQPSDNLRCTLLENLQAIPGKGILFGHHDDTVYGIGWEFEEGESDVKRVCGDYPAMISFDLGEIELGGEKSLDKVPFEKIRQEIIHQYERGGLSSLSWHARNPKTGGDAWDVSDSTVVRSILPGGAHHDKFLTWLGEVNRFILSLKGANGEPIPLLFRPWHEHTGSWFWWGEKLCSVEEYKALWRMTADYLNQHGAGEQLLWAYSSGSEPQTQAEYLERYPGDDLIDLIGFDTYQRENKEEYLRGMDKTFAVIDSVGQAHNKLIALTETGYEGIPDSTWWTETLMPVLEKYPLVYVLVWRNAREQVTHYYAPYPGQISEADFNRFYADPRSLFVNDVNLYK